MPRASRSSMRRCMPTLLARIGSMAPGRPIETGAFTMIVPVGVELKYRYSFDQGGVPKGLDPGGEARIVREKPLLLRAAGAVNQQAVEGKGKP